MAESATLSLATVDYPFETLVSRAAASPPKLILDPDFQRRYKWDKDGWGRASKFIESCLMRIPLPSCYFAENEDRAHLVIDGVQRITTVIRFMEDGFALEGLTAFPELNGKKFSDLGKLRGELESTTIRCVVLRNENPKELVAEIFARLNKGAVELSDQEIRHALFSGRFDDMLQDLAQHKVIMSFGLGKSGRAKRDAREGEELVLRFFAFDEQGDSYVDNLSRFLDRYMELATGYDEEKINTLKSKFVKAMTSCLAVFSEDEVFSDISRAKRRQGVVYYDLLMGTLQHISEAVLREKREAIRGAFEDLCRSEEFRRTTAGGLQRRSSISKRKELWNKKLKGAIGG